jgi:hypothetical protein
METFKAFLLLYYWAIELRTTWQAGHAALLKPEMDRPKRFDRKT